MSDLLEALTIFWKYIAGYYIFDTLLCYENVF